MPIEALPQTTIRAIGSTSVISDAYSVVKELIDNALDASASSLQIEISQNTLDVIQLKDNGHGIPSEDQKLVCKRAFTSKIQTLDDLRNVGGVSLGFRGEAMASVAEMCGAISVTTRVASEVVGQCLKYGRDGEVTGTQRISHPVGTTVRITDFLKHIPVRRQTASKGAAKSLARIKKLLQSYAICQPTKRLSLKVLKSTKENNNWSYAPGTEASLPDAALKVVGTEISSSCVLKQLSSQGLGDKEQQSSDRKQYEVIAFLPCAQFETSKVNNAGQYISVDGRPLSSDRGFGYEIAKIFKQYVRAATSKVEPSKPASDVFLCLHLLCPRGTYDVNIEPAKDDIVFEDCGLVLNLVEDLFRAHYGDLDGGMKSSSKQNKETHSRDDRLSGRFDLLMARKPAAGNVPCPDDSGNDPGYPSPTTPLSHRPPHSDHDGLHKETSNSEVPETLALPTSTRPKGSRYVNPWSISRMNASFQTPRRESVSLNSSSPVDLSSGSMQKPMRRPSESGVLEPFRSSSNLPNLATSRFSFVSPVRQRRQQESRSRESSPETNQISSSRRSDRERDRQRYGNGALDTWFQRTTQVSLQQSSAQDILSQGPSEVSLSSLAQERFGSPARAQQDAGYNNHDYSAPSSIGSPQQSTRDDTMLPDIQQAHAHVSMDSGRGFPVLERWAAQLHEDGGPKEPYDLEKALDFEKRKKEAIQSRRLQLRNGKLPPSSQDAPMPHLSQSSRYLAAKAALTSSQVSIGDPVPVTKLSPHDPRAYLIRQQETAVDGSSNNDPKARRLRTSRLPFEQIPDGSNLHGLSVTCSVDLSSESNSFRSHTCEDSYIESGDETTAFSASDVEDCLTFWNERLALIIKQQYQSRDDLLLPSPKIDLAQALSQHLKDFEAKKVCKPKYPQRFPPMS